MDPLISTLVGAVALITAIAAIVRTFTKAEGEIEAQKKAEALITNALAEEKRKRELVEERLRVVELAAAKDHEIVDGMCDRLDSMRVDMDKRFDKLETMIAARRA